MRRSVARGAALVLAGAAAAVGWSSPPVARATA